MNAFSDTFRWLADPANWTRQDGISDRLVEHVELSLAAVLIAAAIAVPVGLLIGHTGLGKTLAVQTANAGRAVPSFAILSITFLAMVYLAPELAFGFVPTLVALTLLAIPPILVNTYVGVEQVDRDTVEAARGMGMTGRQVLSGIEAPLATPLVMTGLRLAAVQVVATATLAALIGGGGLGRFIVDGLAQGDTPQVVGGAVLVALLAVATELAFALLARLTSPRFMASQRRSPILRGRGGAEGRVTG